MLSPSAQWIYGGLGAAAGLGSAAGGCAYAAIWPSSRLFGRALIAPARPGEIALTFDDGPNPAWTPRLLEILAESEIRATFFLVGSFAAAEPGLTRRIAEAGHLIGNHSWTHPNLALTPSTRVRDELDRTTGVLQHITGHAARFFRPPFGARRPAVLRIARELGLEPVLWNAITTDWSEPSAEKIASSLAATIDRNQSRGQATNLVLHDGGHLGLGANRAPSVSAAGQLIARYRLAHRFVALDAWESTGRL